MTVEQIASLIERELPNIGLIKWHISKHGSVYYKFRDSRLGSIRIADHKSKPKYSYKHSLRRGDSGQKVYQTIVRILSSSYSIEDFDGDKFVLYDREQDEYVELWDFEQYKKCILGRKIIGSIKGYVG